MVLYFSALRRRLSLKPRYYLLSKDGVEQARYALAHAHSSITRIGALRPRTAESGS